MITIEPKECDKRKSQFVIHDVREYKKSLAWFNSWHIISRKM